MYKSLKQMNETDVNESCKEKSIYFVKSNVDIWCFH